MNMDQLIKELMQSEGVRLKPYRCPAGKLTIGIGRNLEDTGISEKEAVYMCYNDVRDRWADLQKYPWFRKLNSARQEAIINMAFNLGMHSFLKFKNMIKALESEDWIEASRQALDSKWAKQVGSRANRISQILRTGTYAS